MPDRTPPSFKHFTAFRSAGEETRLKGPEDDWENEGGHMSSCFGRGCQPPAAERPYKVILSHEQGAETARPFATMRDAEAFIRRNTPGPSARSTLYDRNADGL